MVNHTEENPCRVSASFLVMLTTMLITAITGTTSAKSLYLIADLYANPTPIKIYDIAVNGTLTFQSNSSIPCHNSGALGLAIDSDSKYLFVTYDDSNLIQVIDATTMTDKGTASESDATEMAGIVYDHDKGLLYCVERNTDKLYVYNWQARTTTLMPVSGSPFSLLDATAYGIALDEIDDLLYVANFGTTIRVYHTSDWSPAGLIPVSHPAISIAVDAARNLFYYGSGYSHNRYLTQYNLNTRTEKWVQVPDAGVIGIGIDPATGLIYIGTGDNNIPGGDNIQVYDALLNCLQVIPDIGNPTGLAILSKDIIGYNPLNLNKIVDGSAAGEVMNVGIGDTVTYNICFDNKSNNYSVNNVSIVDALPKNFSFITADGDGIFGHYDPTTHTYTWSYPSLPPMATNVCLKLVVQVNPNTAPDMTITNSAFITSVETGPAVASVNVITKDTTSYKPLNISKNVIKGAVEQRADGKVRLVAEGDTITYGICFNNKYNDHSVTNVSIIDTLTDEVSFVSADGDGAFGRYDPNAHTYTWSYPTLPARSEDTCLKLVVQVNPNTAPGTTITNSATIKSNETEPAAASVNVTTAPQVISYNPLNLSKTIIGDIIPQTSAGTTRYVSAGDTIIYNICYDNKNNDLTVNNVDIIDILPTEVSFVKADGAGEFGQYDPVTHTFTWSYQSLPPKFSGNCLRLTVKVNTGTPPGTIITNCAAIDSDETQPATTSIDVVTAAITYNNLNISKSIIGGTIEQASTGEIRYVETGETIIYSICYDNKANDFAVNNVSIVDNLPKQVSFVKADGDGIFGQYNPIAHTYTWSYPSLSARFPGACLTLVAQVNNNTATGVTVTNSATIDSDETAPATASVDAVTYLNPIHADLSIRPNMLRRDGCCESVLAIVTLPQGIGKDDIKEEPLILNPGNVASNYLLIFGTADRVEVHAWFDPAGLRAAVTGYGEVRVQVTGKLKSGRPFFGEDIIYITKFVGN